MAWPSDLGTSFGGPRGTLEWQPRDVTTLPGGHGGAETSFQTSRVPPPAIRCQTAPTSRPLLGPEGASQRVTHPRPPGLSTPEKTREAFTGRPDPDLAPSPPHGGPPMELTTGRPARHPPGHPGARSRLCGSQEIGNCEPRTSPGCRNVSGWAPRGRLARSRLFHSGGFRHVRRERRRPRVTALTPGEVSGPPLEVSRGRNQGPLHPPWPLPVSPGPPGSRQHCLPHPGRHLRTLHERPEP